MRPKRVATLLAGTVLVAVVGAAPTPLGAAPASDTGTAAPAQASPITVTELPGLADGPNTALDIDESGRAVGRSQTAAGTPHPVLWQNGGVTDLAPTLPAGATGSADGIANNGRIVGSLSGSNVPGVVTWHDGQMQSVSAAPSTGDEAVDLNNNNQILYRDGGRSILWRNGSRVAAPDVAPGVRLSAADVNEWGLVVGTSQPADPDTRRAYRWLPGLPPTRLGTLGGSWSEAVAVNDWGQVVGFSENAAGHRRMFITQGDQLVDLGTLGGDQVGIFTGGGGLSARRVVNNLGHVIGTSTTAAGDTHAFLWRDGRMTDLGAIGPGPNGATTGLPAAVNDLDQVAGASSGGAAPLVDATAWQDGRAHDLGGLTSHANRLASFAVAINNRGQAVGSTITEIGTPGHDRAWLWTVPRFIP